jgi:hypothetical protein
MDTGESSPFFILIHDIILDEKSGVTEFEGTCCPQNSFFIQSVSNECIPCKHTDCSEHFSFGSESEDSLDSVISPSVDTTVPSEVISFEILGKVGRNE